MIFVLRYNATLIFLPFHTINPSETTLQSYNCVKNLKLPVLFVINSYIKESDIEDAISFLVASFSQKKEFKAYAKS